MIYFDSYLCIMTITVNCLNLTLCVEYHGLLFVLCYANFLPPTDG